MDEIETADVASTEATPSPPPRRSRAGVAVVVLAALLLLGAIPIAVVAIGQHSDASDARDEAAAARAARPPLQRRQAALERQRADLQTKVDAFPGVVEHVGTAAGDLADAEGTFTDVVNHAADVHNSGDEAGATNLYRTDGQGAMDTLAQKNDDAKQAMQAARDAVQALKDGM